MRMTYLFEIGNMLLSFQYGMSRESMNLSDMELTSPYEQESKDPASKMGTTTLHQLTTYTKQLKQGQIDPYILEIRRRLQEDIHARREREKRRRKVLVDQLRALEAIEVSKFNLFIINIIVLLNKF